jgi:hypothetical protein
MRTTWPSKERVRPLGQPPVGVQLNTNELEPRPCLPGATYLRHEYPFGLALLVTSPPLRRFRAAALDAHAGAPYGDADLARAPGGSPAPRTNHRPRRDGIRRSLSVLSPRAGGQERKEARAPGSARRCPLPMHARHCAAEFRTALSPPGSIRKSASVARFAGVAPSR